MEGKAMLNIEVPGNKVLRLSSLVLDYNGTLACDGYLLGGVKQLLELLARDRKIHVLTSDTYGTARAMLVNIPCQLCIVSGNDQAACKLAYVESLGMERTVCIGNGRNDHLMLEAAALGIAVLQQEGTALEALMAADVVAPDILAALNLLLQPRRLIATLTR
jgi:soluble P-type ATPase